MSTHSGEPPPGTKVLRAAPTGRPDEEVAEVELQRELDDGGAVTVTFQRSPAGRLVPVQVRIDHPRGVDSKILRNLPLAELDRIANEPEFGQASAEFEILRWTPLRRPASYAEQGEGEFYKHLVARYLTVMRGTSRPAAEIAAESGVPVTTVHRWIRDARRRGHLPPARPGAAG